MARDLFQANHTESLDLFHDVEEFNSAPFLNGNEVQAFVMLQEVARCTCGHDTARGWPVLARGPLGQKHKFAIPVVELLGAYPDVPREWEQVIVHVDVCPECF